MSDAIAFEFQGRTIGVLARHGEAFIFYADASTSAYRTLDSRVFAEPRDLYLALRRLEDERRRAGTVARALGARSAPADQSASAAA